MRRIMSLAKFLTTGSRVNPGSALGFEIGKEVAASAYRHVWRLYVAGRHVLKPTEKQAMLDTMHILMHAERGEGTCSQCPAYLLERIARRA